MHGPCEEGLSWVGSVLANERQSLAERKSLVGAWLASEEALAATEGLADKPGTDRNHARSG